MRREPSTNIVVLLDISSSYTITTEAVVSAGCSYGSADVSVHHSLTKYKDHLDIKNLDIKKYIYRRSLILREIIGSVCGTRRFHTSGLQRLRVSIV